MPDAHLTGGSSHASERAPDEVAGNLIARVAHACDRGAFAALFQHFAPRLKAFFQARGADERVAEDLVQETMLRVWRRAREFDPDRLDVSAWIFGLARDLLAGSHRHTHRWRARMDLPEPCAPAPTPEAASIAAQQHDRLREALQHLPVAQQDAVRAAYFSEMSHGEAHRALGIALGTLKSRLRIALVHLRRALDDPE